MIEAGRVAETNGICCCKHAERWMRPDHAALIEKRQTARGFQNALNYEHDIRASRIIFVENQRNIVLIGPRQNTVFEFGNLYAVFDDDCILTDKIDTADMAVEIDTDTRPVEAGCDLFNMGRFTRTVITGNHHATIIGKSCEDRERRGAVKNIIRVYFRHIGIACRIGWHTHVGIDPEHFAYRNRRIRQIGYIPLNLVHHASRATGTVLPRHSNSIRRPISSEPDGAP